MPVCLRSWLAMIMLLGGLAMPLVKQLRKLIQSTAPPAQPERIVQLQRANGARNDAGNQTSAAANGPAAADDDDDDDDDHASLVSGTRAPTSRAGERACRP